MSVLLDCDSEYIHERPELFWFRITELESLVMLGCQLYFMHALVYGLCVGRRNGCGCFGKGDLGEKNGIAMPLDVVVVPVFRRRHCNDITFQGQLHNIRHGSIGRPLRLWIEGLFCERG